MQAGSNAQFIRPVWLLCRSAVDLPDDAPPGRIRYGDTPCCRGDRPVGATVRSVGATVPIGLPGRGRSAGQRSPGRIRYGETPCCRGDRSVGATVPIGLPGRGRSAGTTLRRGASGMAMLRAAGRDCPVGATVPIGLPGRGRSAGTTGRMCVTVRDAAARFVFGEKVVPLSRSGSSREQFRAQPPTSST